MNKKGTRRLWVVERLESEWRPVPGEAHATREEARERADEIRWRWPYYLKYRVVSYCPELGKS